MTTGNSRQKQRSCPLWDFALCQANKSIRPHVEFHLYKQIFSFDITIYLITELQGPNETLPTTLSHYFRLKDTHFETISQWDGSIN